MSNKNVSILSLTNGQLVISEVEVIQQENTGETLINLVNPCLIEQSISEDGQVNASFTPLATLCANQTVQLNTGAVVYSSAPEDGFMEVYLSRFQRPEVEPEEAAPALITPPKKKLIVPGK